MDVNLKNCTLILDTPPYGVEGQRHRPLPQLKLGVIYGKRLRR
jgi:hypothetical protein